MPYNDDLLFFASGVSNSACNDEDEYRREVELLMDQDKKNHIVYFSSLAMFYSDTRYTRHKRDMEEMVKINFPDYCIVRLGNITWGDNPHTIINYFKAQNAAGHKPELKNELRYVVDAEEFLHWIDMIPPWNCEMNIPGQTLSVEQIWKMVKKGQL